MNRKDEKTIQKVQEAFGLLLQDNDYESISISAIIARSGVSRTAFYAHFKSKKDILMSLTQGICDHVTSLMLRKEDGHDFSQDEHFDFHHVITHLFYHFLEDKDAVRPILNSDAAPIYQSLLTDSLYAVMEKSLEIGSFRRKDVPLELQVHELSGTLSGVLAYYLKNDCKETTEEMADYFFELVH